MLDELLKRRFDSIFFTGGSKYGRVVMEAAAKNLTPVTLELGGKSPCIVGRSANIRLAARRIHVGQAAGCGPDLRRAGLSARSSGPEGRAVPGNEACGRGVFRRLPASKSGLSAYRFGAGDRRLAGMIGASGRVLWGGEFDVRQRYVAPTLIDDPDDDSPAMTEEIFGPLLPVKTFRHIDEAIGYVNRRDKPLPFTISAIVERRSGSWTGRRRRSLRQRYDRPSGQRPLAVRGRRRERVREVSRRSSFDLFSHMRPVVRSSRLIDLPLKYAPYRRLKLYRKLFR